MLSQTYDDRKWARRPESVQLLWRLRCCMKKLHLSTFPLVSGRSAPLNVFASSLPRRWSASLTSSHLTPRWRNSKPCESGVGIHIPLRVVAACRQPACVCVHARDVCAGGRYVGANVAVALVIPHQSFPNSWRPLSLSPTELLLLSALHPAIWWCHLSPRTLVTSWRGGD